MLCQFTVAQPVVAWMLAPRSQVNFINTDGTAMSIGLGTLWSHGFYRWQATHHTGRVGSQLHAHGKWIRLKLHLALRRQNFKFIGVAQCHLRCKHLPHATFAPEAHHMATAIPLVEAPHHRHTLCIRCPNSKTDPCYPVYHARVGTQFFIRAQMGALRQEPNILFAQHRPKTVGVFQL